MKTSKSFESWWKRLKKTPKTRVWGHTHTHTIFVDWKKSFNVHTIQSDPAWPTTHSMQFRSNTNDSLHINRKNKPPVKPHRLHNEATLVTSNKNKAGGTITPDFQMCYESRVTTAIAETHTQRPVRVTETPETTHEWQSLVLMEIPEAHGGDRDSTVANKWHLENWRPQAKRKTET